MKPAIKRAPAASAVRDPKLAARFREFASRLESVREDERARVAREIHDELGQSLTALKFDLAWLHSRTPRSQIESRKRISSMMASIDRTIKSVRRIASELRPAVLDDLGLIPAIEWQVAEFRKRTGIVCRFRSNVDRLDLGPERSAAVFRVVQEGLTNVMRHADASTLKIELLLQDGILKLSIADDGKGISDVETVSRQSIGLIGMRERIVRVGGKFAIRSKPDRGVKLAMSFPI